MKAQVFYDCGDDQSSGASTSASASGGLKSLVRPRYFGGQSLESEDLTALVDWARDRFALQRLRTGWGVVCGLQVEIQPNVDDGVIVRPGYALDACGTDIVVPCSEAVSLAGKCRETTDPSCDDGTYPPSPTAKPLKPKLVAAEQKNEGAGVWPPWDLGNLVPVDLYLHSETADFHHRPALSTSTCERGSDCDYARTQETYEICPRRGEDTTEPYEDWGQKYLDWEKKYLDECFSQLQDLFFPPDSDFKKWVARLYSRPEGARPHTMAFLRRLPQADPKPLETDRTALLFAVLQDRRNAFFAQRCAEMDVRQGVPLARVWMRIESNNQCSIVYIDDFPPFRRELSASMAPARFGEINLSPYIWMPPKEAHRRLCEVGLTDVKPSDLGDIAGWTPKALWEFFVDGDLGGALELQESLSAACGQQLEMFHMNTRFGPRVVALKVYSGEGVQVQTSPDRKRVPNAIRLSGGDKGQGVTTRPGGAEK